MDKHKHRDDAIFAAFRYGQRSLTAIANEAELAISSVSRIVKRMEIQQYDAKVKT